MKHSKKEKIRTSGHFSMDDETFHDEVLSYPDERQTHKWSVSWSDLMMTMFVFFVVLYLHQAGNKDLRFGSGPGKNQISEKGAESIININARGNSIDVYDQTKKAIREVMLDSRKEIRLRPDEAVRIVLASDLFFNSGDARLKLGAKYQLNQIAKVLDESRLFINVIGHTDDLPTRSQAYPTNWELSSKRAVTVARYLIEEKGIDAERIFVSAHSSQQPLISNNTAHGRSLNRRVEIVLMKQMPYAR